MKNLKPGSRPPQNAQTPPPASGGFGGEGNPDIGGGGLNQTQRADQTVEYISASDFGKKGYIPAKTIRAVRMVVVNALFPIEEQREENRRALRQPKPQSMAGTTGSPLSGGPMTPGTEGGMSPDMNGGYDPNTPPGSAGYSKIEPYFDGILVQRRIKYPGEIEFREWADFDAGSIYFSDIKPYRIEDVSDNPYFLPFMRYGQKLVAPLPKLVDGLGDYPNITMPAFVASVNELEKYYTPSNTSPSEMQKLLERTQPWRQSLRSVKRWYRLIDRPFGRGP